MLSLRGVVDDVAAVEAVDCVGGLTCYLSVSDLRAESDVRDCRCIVHRLAADSGGECSLRCSYHSPASAGEAAIDDWKDCWRVGWVCSGDTRCSSCSMVAAEAGSGPEERADSAAGGPDAGAAAESV